MSTTLGPTAAPAAHGRDGLAANGFSVTIAQIAKPAASHKETHICTVKPCAFKLHASSHAEGSGFKPLQRC